MLSLDGHAQCTISFVCSVACAQLQGFVGWQPEAHACPCGTGTALRALVLGPFPAPRACARVVGPFHREQLGAIGLNKVEHSTQSLRFPHALRALVRSVHAAHFWVWVCCSGKWPESGPANFEDSMASNHPNPNMHSPTTATICRVQNEAVATRHGGNISTPGILF